LSYNENKNIAKIQAEEMKFLQSAEGNRIQDEINAKLRG
jgi:hypothetical protein